MYESKVVSAKKMEMWKVYNVTMMTVSKKVSLEKLTWAFRSGELNVSPSVEFGVQVHEIN